MKLWIYLMKFGLWIWFITRAQKAKTALYRLIWEREVVKTVKVIRASSFAELSTRIIPNWWRADGWKQLFDAVSTPEQVQHVWLSGVPPKEGFDCDEYAVYITQVVNDSLESGSLREPNLKRAWFLTVCWVGARGGPNGHNVSLLEYEVDGAPLFKYMDYRMPSPGASTIEGIAKTIVAHYGGPEATLVFWAKQDTKLSLYQMG